MAMEEELAQRAASAESGAQLVADQQRYLEEKKKVGRRHAPPELNLPLEPISLAERRQGRLGPHVCRPCPSSFPLGIRKS